MSFAVHPINHQNKLNGKAAPTRLKAKSKERAFKMLKANQLVLMVDTHLELSVISLAEEKPYIFVLMLQLQIFYKLNKHTEYLL